MYEFTNCLRWLLRASASLGPKKAVQMHREYTTHITATKDPQDFLEHVDRKYTWSDSSTAGDFPTKFIKNVWLFRYFHMFVFTSRISTTDLCRDRCVYASMVGCVSTLRFRSHTHTLTHTICWCAGWTCSVVLVLA